MRNDRYIRGELKLGLSEYSSKKGFGEVVSEACSAWLSKTGNDFAGQFIEKAL